MEQSGAIVTSVETALFELLGAAGTRRVQAGPGARQVSAYILLEDGTRFDGDAVGAPRPDHRRGRLQHRDVRLPGVGHRPELPRPDHRLHLPAHRQLRRLRGGDGVGRDPRARRGHARGDRPRGRARRRGRLAHVARRLRRARRSRASTRARSSATSATRARCAAGSSPATTPEAEARDGDRRRAVDERARPRVRGDAGRAGRSSRATGPRVIAIDTGIKGSIIRNLRERGVHLELHPCDTSADDAARARARTLVFLANGPGDPAALDYVVENVRERRRQGARCSGICLGHQLLCRAVGPRDLQAPVRPPRRQPPGQGPRRPGRIDITSAEPRLRGARPGRRAARSTTDEPRAVGDRLRRGGAVAPEPVRPHGRGPRPARRPGAHGPVPPRGRARARTTRVYLFDDSWSHGAMPRRDDLQQDPRARLRADRDRPGRRVRLLGRAGVQGAARGGLRGRPRSTRTRRRS